MLDKNRLINNFMDMVRIDSPSNQELEMSKWLVNYLKERNIDAIIDDAGKKYGGNTGNVIAYIKGEEGSRPLCLCAHKFSFFAPATRLSISHFYCSDSFLKCSSAPKLYKVI